MSDAIYEIEVKHDAWTGTSMKYDWTVWRISDSARMASGWASTEDEAVSAAQAAIERSKTDLGTVTFYADENGDLTDAPVPQSLRA